MTRFTIRTLSLLIGGLCVVEGCKDLTGSAGLPSGTPNPSIYNNPSGALGMRNAAMYRFEQAIPQYVADAGLLTDELEDVNTGASPGVLLSQTGVTDHLDERILPEGVGVGSYGSLQQVRGYVSQALGALAAYDTAPADTAAVKILRGELYALTGYTEILLSDLFCSGVPLSTLDFQKDFTYQPSSTTIQVYQAALGNLDTALTLGLKSDSLMNLALVLKGRAYLDLGQYAIAADDVSAVPNAFVYQIAIPMVNVFNPSGCQANSSCGVAIVSDREGTNGLPYRASGDPRTAAMSEGISQTTGDSLYFPTKYSSAYSGSGYTPFILASGTEARLIQAEAALHGVHTGAGSWIDQLNALRSTIGLSPIADPGSANPAAQVDTLFTERAAWFFLDGHRQGDLRRLLREYGQYAEFRSQDRVYPTGLYLAPGTGKYGADVNAPIDPSEAENPLFHGCLDRKP